MPIKIEHGFKICRIECNEFLSGFIAGESVVYKKKKWTTRPHKCGPLAVFDTLEHAKKFLTGQFRGNRVIFKCKYKPSKILFLYTPFSRKIDVPLGTKFADKVKITKKC